MYNAIFNLYMFMNNNNNQDDVHSAVMYGKAIVRVHSGHLTECGLAPSGRQLIGQAASSTFGFASRLQ